MLSLPIQGLLWALVIAISLFSIDKATYKALYKVPIRQTGVLACALVFAVLWRIKAGILTGLDLHILGITAATLILGWRLTILSSVLATVLLAAFGLIEFELLPVQLLIGAFIPILLSYLAFIVSYQYLPRHFFVYIFVCAFITAGFTHHLIGGALVGDNAGELLGEISLALEMDCDAEDIALTIHAHPTLHESVGMAAEIFDGVITDLPNAKAIKKKK